MKSFLFFLLSALTMHCIAQPSIRDLTFGNGGVVMTPFSADYSYGYSVIQQANGKIIVSGSQGTGSNEYMFVARYNTDGALDSTFGTAGFLVDSMTTVNMSVAWSLDKQTDGKIVVAGTLDYPSQYDIFIVRFDSSGFIDTTFGNNGRIIADYQGGEDQVLCLKVQADGKLLIGGSTTDQINFNSDLLLMRFNTDGSPDTSFGINGAVTRDYFTNDDGAISIALQNDGKIVIGGVTTNSSSYIDGLIARFMPDGSTDYSFNSNGFYTFDNVGDDDGVDYVTMQSDGKIVAGGISYDANGYENDLLIRLDSAGNPDATFNSTGVLLKNYTGQDSQVSCVLIQPDGKIMTVGYTGYSDYNVLLSRYLSDGTEDSSFGNNGHVVDTISPEDDNGFAAIFQSDGKIVITGTYSVANQEKFFVARYLNDSLINNIPSQDVQSATLFPQPAIDQLYIANCKTNVNAEVLDLNGSTLLKIQNVKSPIDVSSLSQGMYFLRLTDSRNIRSVMKFLKM